MSECPPRIHAGWVEVWGSDDGENMEQTWDVEPLNPRRDISLNPLKVDSAVYVRADIAEEMLAALTEASETLAGLYGGGNTNLADVRLALGKVDGIIAKAKGEMA